MDSTGSETAPKRAQSHTVLGRHPLSTAAGLIAMAWALAVVASVVTTGGIPPDFAVFHGAGTLIREGDYETAYRFADFAAFLGAEYDPWFADTTLVHFLNPPPFGWFAQL